MKLLQHPYFFLIMAPLIWGGNAIAGKFAVGEITPLTLTFLRWLCASIILLPLSFSYVKRDWQLIKPAIIVLFILGSLGFSMFNLFLYGALNYTTVVNVSIEQAAIPALVLLLNFILFKQQFTFLQVIGLICAFLGVLLTVTQGRPIYLFEIGLNKGDALMIGASIVYAVYSIGLRWRPKIHWKSFIFVLSISATVTALPFYIWELMHVENNFVLSFKSIAVLLYVAIFASIIAQVFYAQAVSIIGANRASFAVNLVPIFGSFLAIVILGESLHWYHIVGLILVLLGISLSETSTKKQAVVNSKG